MSMELRAQLVHADGQVRVVHVSAYAGEQLLGSALGEAPDAEAAEDRALQRLLARLAAAPVQVTPASAAAAIPAPVAAKNQSAPAAVASASATPPQPQPVSAAQAPTEHPAAPPGEPTSSPPAPIA
ncbi:MAG: hypothetical protein ACK535_08150, partial [Cyanobacteriota bacterium]